MAKLTIIEATQKPHKKTFEHILIDIIPDPKYERYVPKEADEVIKNHLKMLKIELTLTLGITGKRWEGVGSLYIYGAVHPRIIGKTFPNLSSAENTFLNEAFLFNIYHPREIPYIIKYDEKLTKLYGEIVKENLKRVSSDALLVLYTPIREYI